MVYVIAGAMAVRTKARFPQGERLIAREAVDLGPDPSGAVP
ncbi:MAG: hypothetical protein R3C32_12940 [Chloroflexota bacterium]